MNTFDTRRDEAKQNEERRRYPRNHLRLKVEGRITAEEAGNTPLTFHGHTTDVSLRGLCISTDQTLATSIGQQFKVMVHLFQDEPPIEMIGQLSWLKEGKQTREEQSTQIGLELLGVANSTRGYDRWIERINWN